MSARTYINTNPLPPIYLPSSPLNLILLNATEPSPRRKNIAIRDHNEKKRNHHHDLKTLAPNPTPNHLNHLTSYSAIQKTNNITNQKKQHQQTPTSQPQPRKKKPRPARRRKQSRPPSHTSGTRPSATWTSRSPCRGTSRRGT
jgi:hypothetical protein